VKIKAINLSGVPNLKLSAFKKKKKSFQEEFFAQYQMFPFDEIQLP